jgi:hypothetical protein
MKTNTNGTKTVKPGDTVRSYDFVGRKDCFMEGVVWKVEGELFHAYTTRQVFNGKEREVTNLTNQFRAPLPGVTFLDHPEFQRVVVLTPEPLTEREFGHTVQLSTGKTVTNVTWVDSENGIEEFGCEEWDSLTEADRDALFSEVERLADEACRVF